MKTLGALFLIIICVYPIFIYYNNKLKNTDKDTTIIYMGTDKNILNYQFNYLKKKHITDDLYNHKNIEIQNTP